MRRASTDADGRFDLNGLPAAPVQIHVTSDFDPREPYETRRIAFWVPPIEVDLSVAVEPMHIPVQRVNESRPFFFTGTIEFDAARGAEDGDAASNGGNARGNSDGRSDPRRLRVHVDLLVPDDAVPSDFIPSGPRRPKFRPQRLDVDEAGHIKWACETPHAPVRITITNGQPNGRAVQIEIYPEPSQSEVRKILVPLS